MSGNKDNGLSANDIITYVGIPFAVLGVLPILYNTISTIITLQNVKRLLRKSRLAGITRGDVINHVIEIELPRFIIAPLDREHHSEDYWNIYEQPSLVRGGSWTRFNWKMHTIGLKTQRITYSDQLRQPQAEVSFEDLISYLMDLGAIPHAAGFRTLRTTGLWIPVGTPLLLSPNGDETALSIAPLDDSDGNLSLSVHWSRKWQMRSKTALPPYWMRLKDITESTLVSSGKDDVTEPSSEDSKSDEKSTKEKGESETTQPHPQSHRGPPQTLRCHITMDGLVEARLEAADYSPAKTTLPIDHLQLSTISSPNQKGIWFASAASALGASSQATLWSYTIPEAILAFSRQDSIPCGILVLLSLVPESQTPEWATQYDDAAADREAQMRKMRESGEAVRREMMMTPDQRFIAMRDRQRAESQKFFDENNDRRRRDAQRAEQRIVEAVGSMRWSNKLVAEHNLTWLKSNGLVSEEDDVKVAVEGLLFKMVNDVQLTRDVTYMLDGWKSWATGGGLKKADYLMLKENQTMFAWASLVLAVIHDSVGAAEGSLAKDLQESVRIWKRVRLG